MNPNETELVKKVRSIEIKSNKLVDEIFSGNYRSRFRGQGMEFDTIRQYMPGDDVRKIDWNVTARSDKVFVKQFCEERALNMFLLIDASRSNNFGRKKELIAEISATLAFSAIRNNDKVGVIFFTGKVEKFVPSKNGKSHVMSIIKDILNYQPQQGDTNIAKALQFFSKIEKKSSVVFLISDFLDYSQSGYERELKVLSKHHDLIRIRVVDRAEEYIPAGAIFTFQDLESGENFVVDTTKQAFELPQPDVHFKRNLITVHTDEDYVIPLKQFFDQKGLR